MRRELDGYARERRGQWGLWVDRGQWASDWWEPIRRALEGREEGLRRSRHAATSTITLAPPGGRRAYLKIYRPPGLWRALKEQVRISMPRRVLAMSQRLSAQGFKVPRILAVGEKRRLGVRVSAFLLAEDVGGAELREVARRLARARAALRLAAKRRILSLVGAEVGRLHELGYVHGDLVVTNILLREDRPETVWLIDHDRSRGPLWLGLGHRQRRNLVQLNRIELCGVTNSDRLRVFSQYAAVRGWPEGRMRAEARRIARLTKARRAAIAQAAKMSGSRPPSKGEAGPRLL